MLSNIFHLAIPAGDLDVAIGFYCNVLGCTKGNSEINITDAWADIDFWGNELTLHATKPQPNIDHLDIHSVDMGEVLIPHFGVHLKAIDFYKLKKRLEENNIPYISKPYIRFKDTDLEQETMFIKDTHCNILELKTLKYPEQLFNT